MQNWPLQKVTFYKITFLKESGVPSSAFVLYWSQILSTHGWYSWVITLRYCYHFCNILRTWLCIVLVEVCNRQRSWYCVPIASLAYISTGNTGSCICWCILCRVERNLLKVIVPYFSDYKLHHPLSSGSEEKNLYARCAGVWNAPINLVDMKLDYAHLHTHHKISYLPISGN